MKNKLTHTQAGFHKGHHGSDRCGSCKSFERTNLCKKVLGPLTEDDWCAVGVGKKDGHRYDPSGPRREHGLQSMINRRQKNAPNPQSE